MDPMDRSSVMNFIEDSFGMYLIEVSSIIEQIDEFSAMDLMDWHSVWIQCTDLLFWIQSTDHL